MYGHEYLLERGFLRNRAVVRDQAAVYDCKPYVQDANPADELHFQWRIKSLALRYGPSVESHTAKHFSNDNVTGFMNEVVDTHVSWVPEKKFEVNTVRQKK